MTFSQSFVQIASLLKVIKDNKLKDSDNLRSLEEKVIPMSIC